MSVAKNPAPELSVSVAYRRPRLVLDPWLCLDSHGPALIRKLQACAELWLVRELWHILDNSHYFVSEPAALVSDEDATRSGTEYGAWLARRAREPRAKAANSVRLAEVCRSLQFWERLRLSSDLSGLKLFWLGDGLSESLLPDGAPVELHAAHERLVEDLDRRLAPRSPVRCAQRDALALALALGGVPILSVLTAADDELRMGHWLSQAGLTCHEVPEQDELLALERERWRALLVRADCASLVWAGLRLALFHVHGAPPVHAAAHDAHELETPYDSERPRVFWHAL